ncbi:hypothetical protein TNCV_2631871, partial [Trichonephila clavipes]
MAPPVKEPPATKTQTQANRVPTPPQQVNPNQNSNAALITQTLQGIIQALTTLTAQITNREVTHPVHSTNHSACFPRSSSQQSISISSHQTRTSTPPTSYHHVIFYVTPVSQSGRCLLTIKVSPTTTGNIHSSFRGRKENARVPCPIKSSTVIHS